MAKTFLIPIAFCFMINEVQGNFKANIHSLSSFKDYGLQSNINGNWSVSVVDLSENVSNNEIKKRTKRDLQPIRGDQGPPPDDFDYSNFIDEEPERGDLGGHSFDTFDKKNIGGSTTDIRRFPHQVSLTYYNNFTEQYEHICGGSIITPNVVLTAAHCTYTLSVNLVPMFQVRVGSSSSISGGKLIKIKAIINHEYYKSWNADNDIAIIVLAKQIYFSKTISRISIASKCRAVGAMATVSGWGYLEENTGIPSPNLNYMNVPLIEFEQCRKAYKGFHYLTESMICAGYLEGGKHSCATDPGGPLVENGELIGIVSWNQECGRKNKPGIYTDVFYMRQWIINKLKLYSV